MSLPSTRVPFENPPRPEEDVPPAWEPTAFWGHQTFWNSHLLLVHRLMRGASLFLPHFWNIIFAQFDFNYFSIDIRKCEDIDHELNWIWIYWQTANEGRPRPEELIDHANVFLEEARGRLTWSLLATWCPRAKRWWPWFRASFALCCGLCCCHGKHIESTVPTTSQVA